MKAVGYFVDMANEVRDWWRYDVWDVFALLAEVNARDMPIETHNTLFSSDDLLRLQGSIRDLRRFDRYLRRRLVELNGVRAWEYGHLVNAIGSFEGLSVLEIGPGPSTLPFYMASKGARVTMLELPATRTPQLEEKCARKGIALEFGDMRKLPFHSEAFDLVTCISVLEHLHHGHPDPERTDLLEYEEFVSQTIVALKEMSRVLKIGGRLYVTTEACLPDLVGFDEWLGRKPSPVVAAYDIAEIERSLIPALRDAGVRMIGPTQYSHRLLLSDPRRGNYRNRYITTFILYGAKEASASK